jgi:hypothetical protein
MSHNPMGLHSLLRDSFTFFGEGRGIIDGLTVPLWPMTINSSGRKSESILMQKCMEKTKIYNWCVIGLIIYHAVSTDS